MEVRRDHNRASTVRRLQKITQLLPEVRSVLTQAFPNASILIERLEKITKISLEDELYRAYDIQLLDIEAAMEFYRDVANDPLQRRDKVLDALRTLMGIVAKLSQEYWAAYVLIDNNQIQADSQDQFSHLLERHTKMTGLNITHKITGEYENAIERADLEAAAFHTDTLNGVRADYSGKLPLGGFTTWGGRHEDTLSKHMDGRNFLKISDRVLTDLDEDRPHGALLMKNFRWAMHWIFDDSVKKGDEETAQRAKFVETESKTISRYPPSIEIPERPSLILPPRKRKPRLVISN